MEDWVDPELDGAQTENKLVFQRRAQSRFVNFVKDELIAFVGNGKTARRANTLIAYGEKIREKNELIQNYVESALTRKAWKEEETKSEAWLTNFGSTEQTRVDAALKGIREALADFTYPEDAQPSGVASDADVTVDDDGAVVNAHKFKSVPELKPDIFKISDNPQVFREFRERWASWFDTSRVFTMTLEQQQNVFLRNLDENLAILLRIKVEKGVTTMEQCMNLLKAEFNDRWPLLARRYEVMTYKQAPGQEYSIYLGNLIEKSKEADIDDMTPQETMALMCIVGCRDTELQSELLKIDKDKLSLEEIRRVSNLYECNIRIQSSLAGNPKTSVEVRKTEVVPKFFLVHPWDIIGPTGNRMR